MQLEQYAELISEMINRLEPLHVLDYGCGPDVALAKALKVKHAFKYQAFDKDVPKFSGEPFPADVVVCTRVLGECDEAEAEEALDNLRRLTEGVCVMVVNHSVMPAVWWLPRIMVRFDLQTYQVAGDDSFYAVAYAHPKVIENEAGEKL